jgi:hypothetical protein
MSASTGDLIRLENLIEARPTMTSIVSCNFLVGWLAQQANLMLRAAPQAKR